MKRKVKVRRWLPSHLTVERKFKDKKKYNRAATKRQNLE